MFIKSNLYLYDFNHFSQCPEGADHLARSYEEAIEFAKSPSMKDITDTIWVMGGAQIYQV